MKPLCLIISISLFITGLAKAQTNSSITSPKATTSSSAAQTTSTNRRQELYDQYNGITKKPTPAPTSTPVATSTPVSTPTATAPAPVASRPVRRTEPKPEPAVAKLPSQAGLVSESTRVRIGVRGGVTYPIYLDQTAGIDPAVGFVGGLVMHVGRGKLSFQPEINYSRITQNVSASGFSTGSIKAATDQIVVPLLLKIASGSFDGNRFFLNIGPYGAYLASVAYNGVKQEITGSQGRFSFGAAAGVGAMLKAGPGHFTIEVRGLYGLGNSSSGFNTDSKTILGEGTLGYVFPLGR